MNKNTKTNSGKTRQKRVGPLQTRGQILSKLGRVYRETRKGELPSLEAKTQATILQGMATVIKDGDAEQLAAEIAAFRSSLAGNVIDSRPEPELIPPPAKRIEASH